MTTHRLPFRLALLAMAAALLALPAAAARRNDDPLSLVPADAAAVGVVRWNELRSSPLGAKLLSETDHVTVDGDAARFMAEARLSPKDDVDVIVVAGSPAPSEQGQSSGLVLFGGRFDTDRLSAALAARGGQRKSATGSDYYLLPEKGSDGHGRPGAVAFASAHLVIAGDEASVVAALARRVAGGADFASLAVLGSQFSRISPDASAWALVDVKRFPMSRKASVNVSGQAGELIGAMKSVSVVALQAAVRGDALDVGRGRHGKRRDAAAPRGLDPRRPRDVAPGGAGEVARGGRDAAPVQGCKRRPGRHDQGHADRRLSAVARRQARRPVGARPVARRSGVSRSFGPALPLR